MPEPTSIIAMIAAIKHSIDIVKVVKDADYDLDKSILKEKIAVLVDSLLEAKIQASETLDVIQEKDRQIKVLEERLNLKANLYYSDGVYFAKDDKSYSPFCPHCWEVKSNAVHLKFLKSVDIVICEITNESKGTNLYFCPSCKNSFYHP
jgi:hypothetical protein